ncbi:MAG: transglycosylase domain-containing protein, partial [Spirochaetales bacterium]|nr:transglycosylase domain-containing protein [Spirochaetales bacterium]
KRYTKNEILAVYLNHVPFGYGLNGVQSASQFFFNKDVRDLTYAEAASLITVISNPTFYSFIRFPQNHKKKQKEVLAKMVRRGVITKADADKSFDAYWKRWQMTSQSSRGAFYNREDKAPFFSNWVLQQIEKDLPSYNVYKDGLTIRTTLDIDYNLYADKLVKKLLEKQQKVFDEEQEKNFDVIQNKYIDSISLLSHMFGLSNVNIGRDSLLKRGITEYQNKINSPLNLTVKLLGLENLDELTENSYTFSEATQKKNEDVQAAVLAIDNATGQVLTMIGGKHFDVNNRFNYAMQGRRQPGSSFKPLVYSAAFDTGRYTASTVILDEPTVFTFGSEDSDDWYKPQNYGGLYYGKVSVRRALRRSLNIPAVKIFYDIGKDNNYKVPIDRAAQLLGINAQSEIDARFGREASTVLGTGSVSLAEMVNAYSVFANQGQRRVMNCILYVEDRDGRVIWEPWNDVEKYYRDNKKKLQVISAQNAFIVTDVLKGTVHSPDGFLYKAKRRIVASGRPFPDVELAAKSGTTQLWSDGWVLGYSPEITLGIWIGFKQYGLSLGYGQDGAVILGDTWVDYMRMAHLSSNKESLHFQPPANLSRIKVCAASGKLPSEACNEELVYPEYFLPGTLPKTTCDVCSQMKNQRQQGLSNFSSDLGIFGDMDFSGSSLNVDEDLLLDEGSLFDDDGGYDFEDEEVQLLTPNTEPEGVFAEPEKKETKKEQVEEVKTVVSSHEPEETVTEKVIEVPAEKPDEISEQSENNNITDSSSEIKEEQLSDVTSDS